MGFLVRPYEVVIGQRLNDRLCDGMVVLEPKVVNNPLGSHAGVQKLGAVYVSLACLPPDLASTLESIFLVSLFKTDNKSFFGNGAIFKEIIAELNFLETSGIDIMVGNKTYKIFFKLGLILGDNLGLHSILGFVESFVAKYPCRFCKTPKNECQIQTKQDNDNLRNPINYSDDVITDDVSRTGIKELCVWNDVESFDVTSNFSVDIMHDMLEGVCKYDVGFLLKELIFNLKYFSIDTLNERIESFNYGPTDIRNRPTLINEMNIKRSGCLKMSASEMSCFMKYFGLIIGDMVPVESENEDIVLLESLITEHHEIYLRLFRGTSLKPKHHHMVHYPLIIKNSGPLSLFWSMRFEAKHRELKETAHSTTSRKNITFTLAMKQQLKFSYKLLAAADTNFYTSNLQTGPIISLSNELIQLYIIKTLFLSEEVNFSGDDVILFHGFQ
ncbi:uncharacterized protein LOC126552640 [Aphis gossypii]|uniref:uncharacterized protein LOC126552640 n=1 Tax=Aphis gossypii TaxID=80765 RepID=UPI00215930DD|nr:uncharacterized protein LOC126552640 [Aphis gossypii]